MKDLLILASGFAAAAVRAGVFLLVVFRLKLAKKPGIRSAAAVFAGAAVVTVIFSRLSGVELPDFYHIITEAAWFAACVSRFQEADFRMSLFTAVFYEISVWFWQFLVAAWAGVWFHAAKFPAYHTSGLAVLCAAGCCCMVSMETSGSVRRESIPLRVGSCCGGIYGSDYIVTADSSCGCR